MRPFPSVQFSNSITFSKSCSIITPARERRRNHKQLRYWKNRNNFEAIRHQTRQNVYQITIVLALWSISKEVYIAVPALKVYNSLVIFFFSPLPSTCPRNRKIGINNMGYGGKKNYPLGSKWYQAWFHSSTHCLVNKLTRVTPVFLTWLYYCFAKDYEILWYTGIQYTKQRWHFHPTHNRTTVTGC